MTFKKAKNLSIKKWEWICSNHLQEGESINEYEDRLCDAIPELKPLSCNCAFCELYDPGEWNYCIKCPFNIRGITCGHTGHIYTKWEDSNSNRARKRHAVKILEFIKNSTEMKN